MAEASPPTCEEVRIALIEGEHRPEHEAHLAGCDECRFFVSLSRKLGGPSRMSVGAASGLGAGFEAVLQAALEGGEPLLGRYRLERFLGGGGQGQVYLAFDEELKDRVALKFVRLDRDTHHDSAIEVANARKIPHPNVCRVFHTERHGTVRLIEMEYVEGPTLAARLGKVDRRWALRCFRKICEAMVAVHQAGVLHLDLKPQNVLLRGDEPVLTDFGLSVRPAAEEAPIAPGGTLAYMPPEQRLGGPVDQRSDVFALGRILEDLLGVRPGPYRRVIQRARADVPGERYPDVASLLRAFDAVGWRRTAPIWLGVAALGVPLAILGAPHLPWVSPRPRGAMILGGRTSDAVVDRTAEWFDARAGVFRPLPPVPDGSLCEARALVLGDGKVHVIGGGGPAGCSDDRTTTQRVRIFDPETSRWTTPECQTPCMRLPGGGTFQLDPVASTWRAAQCNPEGPCLMFGRNRTTALGLASGDGLALAGCAGGCNGPNAIEQTVAMNVGGLPMDPLAHTGEIYDFRAGVWRLTPPSPEPHISGAAVQLGGFVFVCGGNDGFQRHVRACERYDLNNTFNGQPPWTDAGTLPSDETPRIVVVDGMPLGVWPTESRLWRDGVWLEPVPLAAPQAYPRLIALGGGRVLLTGGLVQGAPTRSAQIFERDAKAPRGGRWRLTAPMTEQREGHVALALEDGRILVAGGCQPTPSATAELFDPATERWTPTGRMSTGRCSPEAVLLRAP